MIYTTNAIESLNMQLPKIAKTRGHFPIDDAAIKLLGLALRNVLAKSVRATFDWKVVTNQFACSANDLLRRTDNNFKTPRPQKYGQAHFSSMVILNLRIMQQVGIPVS